ncbi:MAG: helix-turn-helix transcriptional regulator [Mesorhizobium sp.]|nr:MAG: helix-turn-helix transcriptional regulator [Mesorhizobium sp.]TIV24653.1 MAG: helix-turn-helix transcriptional regulator [Mesorhizobium sp.]TIV65501.1 MAG: helix-turn-helix transcriptional regulator [Mesorhizobium sp.]TIW04674.1 MAG: helix-turn-helix transcriptional regulator [Mesorhizobium sp.]
MTTLSEEDRLSEVFGEKLRNRRIELGLTLEALAEKIGSTKAYVWQLENKKPAKPSGELLLKIANVLDISAEYLIDDSVSTPTDTQVRIALARGMAKRGLSQRDVDQLFKISDMLKDGKTPEGSK